MKPIDELDKKLHELLSSRKAFTKHYDKDALSSYIDLLISDHKMISDTLAPLSGKYSTILANKLKDTKKATAEGFGSYINFRKRLMGNALDMEMKSTMSSIVKANLVYIDILNDIQSDIDKLFTIKKINLFNMRISHVIIIGVLYQSEQLAKFSKYMQSILSLAIDGKISELPKYRNMFIEANVSNIAACITAIHKKAGVVNYKGMVKSIKISASDFTLLTDDNVIQVKKAEGLKTTPDTRRVLLMGINGLPGMQTIGEITNNIKQKLHEERVLEQEWMKAHVALLIAKLDGMDEHDPEYIKLVTIIKKYEDMINKLQRKIDKRK